MKNVLPMAALGLLLASAVVPAHAGARLRTLTLEAADQGATLTLGLSQPVKAHVYTLDAPRRVVIDLPATQRGTALRLPAAEGLVTAVRAAPRENGAYRLVLELRSGTAGAPRVTAAGSGASYRLQVSVGEVAEAATTSVAATAPVNVTPSSAASPPAASPPAADSDRRVTPIHSPGRNGRDIIVAVDAGHGGEDPGASGPAGTHEKDVTLAIARALAARLNEHPGMRAVLTRDSDRLVDLRERFERARNARADLFVSIHADSVRDRGIAGASVYTLSYRGASSEAARRLADHENATVLKGGVSLAGVNPNLATVLLDASQSQTMGASVEAADQVLSALDQVGAVRKKIVQHAGFVVLKSPDVPSMLVETAYISNPAEERNLRSAAYQARLAGAIEAGLAAYFQRHPPDGTRYADARPTADDPRSLVLARNEN